MQGLKQQLASLHKDLENEKARSQLQLATQLRKQHELQVRNIYMYMYVYIAKILLAVEPGTQAVPWQG